MASSQVLTTEPPLKAQPKLEEPFPARRETEHTDYSCEDGKIQICAKKKSNQFFTNLSQFATSQPQSAMILQRAHT